MARGRSLFSDLAMFDGGHQRLSAHNVHDAREIVGEHVQRHLGGYLRKTLHQEVGRPHPHLQSAEGMFDRRATLAHRLRVFVEALLYGLQYMLMLPAGDASLHAGRAAMLERAVAARIRPIAPQLLPVLLVRVVVLELFASRTAIHILLTEIDKVLLAEATLCFRQSNLPSTPETALSAHDRCPQRS